MRIIIIIWTGTAHEVTIVMFSRIFYNAKELSEFPDYMKVCLQKVNVYILEQLYVRARIVCLFQLFYENTTEYFYLYIGLLL